MLPKPLLAAIFLDLLDVLHELSNQAARSWASRTSAKISTVLSKHLLVAIFLDLLDFLNGL